MTVRPDPQPTGATRWDVLSEEDQKRVRRLLTIDPDDNLDDVIARAERALQILRGEKS